MRKQKEPATDSDAASLVSGGDLDKECDAGVCYPKWGSQVEDPEMPEVGECGNAPVIPIQASLFSFRNFLLISWFVLAAHRMQP